MPKGIPRLDIDRGLLVWQSVMLGSLALLAVGLFFFQVIRADKYIELASQNRLRIIRILPPRGIISDANGTQLAVNVRTFDIKGYPMDLFQPGELEKISSLFYRHGIPLSSAALEQIIRQQYWAPYRAVSVATNLTFAQVADLVMDPAFPKRLFPFPVWRRVYPAGSLVAHVLGYVGEISQNELESRKDAVYQAGDDIGKNGLEFFYEDRLRGHVGEEAVEVDSMGQRLRTVSYREPQKGTDLRLTLDLPAQRVAAELMKGRRGAIVALDVRDGSIKVFYSSPSYDPNPLTWGISPKEWAALNNDPNRPLMNRVIGGCYPPGSTFKIVTALAALSDGVVTPWTTVFCPGFFRLGVQVFHCWLHSGHGTESLVPALRDSCDVYFYQVGVWCGIDRLTRYASLLGVGKVTGVDIPGEIEGNLAGEMWKKKHFGEGWYMGDTANYAIGQGFVLMTPLQLARAYAAIANGGYLVTPHFIQEERSPANLHLNPQALKVIQQGLAEVVRSGTGRMAGQFGVSVAGKTGSAQNPHGPDHAWFAGYSPVDHPHYVAVALLEAGEHGGSAAAPPVGKILATLEHHEQDGEGGKR